VFGVGSDACGFSVILAEKVFQNQSSTCQPRQSVVDLASSFTDGKLQLCLSSV
jgi:hypothetical protein